MVEHATRAQPADKPLTAKALNAFFEKAASGIEKGGFTLQTTQDLLCEVASETLPVVDPHPDHDALGYALAASRKGEKLNNWSVHKTLPETLGELKQRIDRTANYNFDDVPSDVDAQNARKRFDKIMQDAYRAAETAMGQSNAR